MPDVGIADFWVSESRLFLFQVNYSKGYLQNGLV